MIGTGTSRGFRMWGFHAARQERLSDGPMPSEAQRADWRAVAADETAPDRTRAICAMALLYDGSNGEIQTKEVAEVLGWELDRTKTAIEAVREAGWTNRIR